MIFYVHMLSHVQLFATQEYWSELPFPLPVDLSDLRIESLSLAFPALVGGFSFTTSAIWEVLPEVTSPFHFMHINS